MSMNNYGLRDKIDLSQGQASELGTSNQKITLDHLIFIDTRDCVGSQSLQDAITVFKLKGGREAAVGIVNGATGNTVGPIVLTMSTVTGLANGDEIIVRGVSGNTNANGNHIIQNINTGLLTIELQSTIGNGNYTGGGEWERPADSGYPVIDESVCFIEGNNLTVRLPDTLRDIRTISLDDIVIPRDIIPIEVYIGDLVETSKAYTTNVTYTSVESIWTTFIPQEAVYMRERMIGYYSTPIDIFRSYVDGAFSPADTVTPPPLQLWNPPFGVYPSQPRPYPFQTVPTYRSDSFPITGQPGTFHLVLGGYGLYDLLDWTSATGVPVTDAAITSIVRKLLLLLICPKQSLNNVDYIEMILNSNTVTAGNLVSPFGYGDFQRFVPGPGVGQNYQPGTSDNADPRTAGPDWTVPFPDFNGNVWGPYDSPGDRFQKLGLRTIFQDFYLNGDINNLLGFPLIKSTVPTEDLMSDPIFGLNFSSLIEVTLDNADRTTNPNMLNAMRIWPNGFGAATIRARGFGTGNYSNIYQSAGGQGPSSRGIPPAGGAWVNSGVYGGGGTFQEPIPQGPFGPNITPGATDPTYVGDGTVPLITHRASWADLGTNNGAFTSQIFNYTGYVINDVPDSNLVIKIEQSLRNQRVISTNQAISNAMMSVPVRLNLSAQSGTIQYLENPTAFLTSSGFWEKRFLTPSARLSKLNVTFETYEGTQIPLEKMFQIRRSLQFLNLFNGILNSSNILADISDIKFFFLFDPLNPKLLGRTKRYLSFVLRVNCYQYINVGVVPERIGPSRLELLKPPTSTGPDGTETDKKSPYGYLDPGSYRNYG